ncbi:PIG-L deacetylase family protein [Streptomyces katsurahamanus]|uniref:GlcNAc-PI de-N-acetylase n=1 Tax=Streptomyces katsurahamanus TaxID=2577098 RepID=A0ABW9NYB0_9ACTN|nr:PIG-L deacetylase family protein [Streptomyces katsurahamanus]MQS38310.1 GlcNAc-PI de-N-acetylase [Streptomyces katsurahamanus]
MVFGLPPGSTVLVVAPHPDDETLGAGGTIARLTAAQIGVHVLVIACRSHPGSDPVVRARELVQACTVLGVASHHIAFTGSPAATDPGARMAELVHLIESGPGLSLRTLRPAGLLIPADGSFHQDHRAVHDAAVAAARPSEYAPALVLGYRGPEDTLWTSQAGARGTVAVDTSGVSETKAKALSAYTTQMRSAPHPRSPETIAALDRAAGASAGTIMAELLVPYRLVA